MILSFLPRETRTTTTYTHFPTHPTQASPHTSNSNPYTNLIPDPQSMFRAGKNAAAAYSSIVIVQQKNIKMEKNKEKTKERTKLMQKNIKKNRGKKVKDREHNIYFVPGIMQKTLKKKNKEKSRQKEGTKAQFYIRQETY